MIPYPAEIKLTPEFWERCLDRLAQIIDQCGDEGARLLPIYERIERELADSRAKKDKMADIRARLTRERRAGESPAN